MLDARINLVNFESLESIIYIYQSIIYIYGEKKKAMARDSSQIIRLLSK